MITHTYEWSGIQVTTTSYVKAFFLINALLIEGGAPWKDSIYIQKDGKEGKTIYTTGVYRKVEDH